MEMKWEEVYEKIRGSQEVTENFRALRHWCSQSEENRMECKVIVSYLFNEGKNLLRNDFVIWQFIANATVSLFNAQILRNHLMDVEEIVQIADEKLVNAIYMCLHNCFNHFPDFQISDTLITGIIDNIHLEFPLIVAEDVVKTSGTLHASKLEEFLQIITSHSLVHPLISPLFLDAVAKVYKINLDDVLQSKIEADRIQLTQTATEFLSVVAPHHKQLQNDKSLLTSVIYMLKMMEESECCQPLRSIEELRKMGEVDGVVNLKCDLVKLVTSLCHQNTSNQNLVRDCGLIPVILDNMRPDARNPFIREACIHSIQVLCENNLSIQQFISQMSPVNRTD